MTWPVPDQYDLSTPYGKRGSSWSCNKDSSGKGVHTGADFACPSGTPVYATIAGEVRHRNYGSAFGNHQVAISPDPGQPFEQGEVFYAHMRTRVADGTRVKPGDKIGEVGTEGNVTGPHLHYEFHPNTKNQWNCSVHADPAPTLTGDEDMPTASEIAKAVWKDDIIPSNSESNPTWMAGSYLKEMYTQLQKINANLEKLNEKLSS